MYSPRLSVPLLASAITLASFGTSAPAAEVTYERLVNADKEPQNWLMVHRTYDAQRFSPLNQITKQNVKNLRLLFAVAIGGTNGNESVEATPLVEDGFM
jgi:alcohol dehydrogenase (cytochrome c)